MFWAKSSRESDPASPQQRCSDLRPHNTDYPPGLRLHLLNCFGLICLRFREVQNPLGFLLLVVLEREFALLDGAPRRRDVFPLQDGHLSPAKRPLGPMLVFTATQQRTSLARGEKRGVTSNGRHRSSTITKPKLRDAFGCNVI